VHFLQKILIKFFIKPKMGDAFRETRQAKKGALEWTSFWEGKHILTHLFFPNNLSKLI